MNSAKKKIYFICHPQGPAENAGFEHQLISLAEGLQALGHLTFSNINYWKNSLEENDYLLRYHEGISYKDCDYVVFTSNIISSKLFELLPEDLFSKDRKYKLIFIDDSDGIYTPGFDKKFREVDYVLKCHYCKKYVYPSNFIPWQFGLSNRIIEAVAPLKERKNEILVNFRVKHLLREWAEKCFVQAVYNKLSPNASVDPFDAQSASETEKLFWKQTGRRHYTSYYKRLSESLACAAFGGYPDVWYLQGNFILIRIYRKLRRMLKIPVHYNRIYQFDSWRFWESLVAGCCTFHVDFEKYGLVFPVMPVNGIHYVGIDFDKMDDFNKLVLEDRIPYTQIGINGRKWVLENYSPEKIAARFLEL